MRPTLVSQEVLTKSGREIDFPPGCGVHGNPKPRPSSPGLSELLK